MAMGIRVLPDALRSRDSATFTGSYQTLGTALGHPAVIAKFVNNSTVLATISWDGVTDHDIYPGGSYTIYDITSNEKTTDGFFIGKGTQFWVKGSAGTGSVYLVILYASEV